VQSPALLIKKYVQENPQKLGVQNQLQTGALFSSNCYTHYSFLIRAFNIALVWVLVFFFFFFGSTQGLTLAGQVLYHLSHSTSPVLCSFFSR
jgi:uncharacterized membrane protein